MDLVARDIMTTSVVAVPPWMHVEKLAQLLAGNNISGVPVVDRGRMVGIATEADILRRRRGQDTVRSIMTADVIAVSEVESLPEIAFLLYMKRINRVPVLRDGKLVGIVSRADIIRALATRHADTVDAAEESWP